MRKWRVLQQRVSSYGFLRWVLVWVCFCFLVFIVGQTSTLKLKETTPTCSSSCHCYCSSPQQSYLDLSVADCGKDDPVINEEVKKDVVTMLSEELNFQKIVANETLEHSKSLIMGTKKTISEYQKEAEKCNVSVETCEEARERIEAELIQELRLSTLWKNRAHQYGWNHIASF